MPSTVTRRFFHWNHCNSIALHISAVQAGCILLIAALTYYGLLTQYEYDGTYTLFLLITGPFVWFASCLSSNFLIHAFTIENNWCSIVLVPGLLNIVLVFVQNLALSYVAKWIVGGFLSDIQSGEDGRSKTA